MSSSDQVKELRNLDLGLERDIRKKPGNFNFSSFRIVRATFVSMQPNGDIIAGVIYVRKIDINVTLNHVPNVSPPNCWRAAPFFAACDTIMDDLKDCDDINNDPSEVVPFNPDVPSIPNEELQPDKGSFISPFSVLRFALDRGNFSYSLFIFDAYSGTTNNQEVWTDSILSNSTYCVLLMKACIYHLVEVFRSFHFEKKDAVVNSLITLISQ
ncbi:hypothetical protein LguiA_025153 [Lonicera macranthoides]